jgi:hypothetical protein
MSPTANQCEIQESKRQVIFMNSFNGANAWGNDWKMGLFQAGDAVSPASN